MPTKDGFDPALPLPEFLTDRAERGIGRDFDGAVTTSPFFKASILIAAAAATGIAVLAMGNPAALFADVSASLVDNSSPQSTPAIQSAADAPASVASSADAPVLPPATNEAPPRNEVALSEPAGKEQTESSEPSSETLFRQFQAWAAEKDAQAQGEPVQPVEDAPSQAAQNVPAPAAENARAPSRSVQKRRQVRAAVDNARAEMRTQKPRKQARRAPSARAERPSVQDARAQDTSVQNSQAPYAQAPSFFPMFGLGN